MTVAVCYKCGGMKQGAFVPCTACGHRPSDRDSLALSLALTDHYLDAAKLEKFAARIRAGKPIELSPATKAGIERELQDSGIEDLLHGLATEPPPATLLSSESIKEQAGTTVQTAHMAAIALFTQWHHRFPLLKKLSNTERWDYFVTCATTASTIFHLKSDDSIPHAALMEHHLIIALEEIFPRAREAIIDLVHFVDNTKPPVVDVRKMDEAQARRALASIEQLIGASIGAWLVINLKGRKLDNSDLALVSALGQYCYQGLGRQLAAGFVGA